MSAWVTRRDDIINAAITAPDRAAAKVAVAAIVGSTDPERTWNNRLRREWSGWRVVLPRLPRLQDLYGNQGQGRGRSSNRLMTPPPAPSTAPSADAEEETRPRSIAPSAPVAAPGPEPHAFRLPKERRDPEPYPSVEVVRLDERPTKIWIETDQHYPVHDREMEAAKVALFRDLNPDLWLGLGDLYDSYGPSTFPKELDRIFAHGYTLAEEIESARPYLAEVCRIVKRADLLDGNHERRTEKIIDANPWMAGLLDWAMLSKLPPRACRHRWGTRLMYQWRGCDEPLPLRAEHGDAISPGARYKAAWLMDRCGPLNAVFGHWHAEESCQRTRHEWDGERRYGTWSIGHSSDPARQGYLRGKDCTWQQGIAIVEVWEAAGRPRFTLTQVPYIDHRLCYGGRVYDGRRCQ